jgi:replicative DNA helicase
MRHSDPEERALANYADADPRLLLSYDDTMDTLSVDDLLEQVIDDLESPEPWVPTGFPKLDKWLDGGLRPGEVMLVAARPSVGKSAFALQLAMHMVSEGNPVSVWSLEMRPKQWVRRGLAAISGVQLSKIRTGQVSDNEIRDISAAMHSMKGASLYFAPEQGDTTPEGFTLQSKIEAGVHGSKVMLIDYLQLMEPPSTHSREQEVAKHSRNLKLTANRLGISIIALAQLNRDAQGKVPAMSDLRESGSLEQDADIIVFLHRDVDKDTNLLKDSGLLLLAKNRDGRTGGVSVRYDWRNFRFEELA